MTYTPQQGVPIHSQMVSVELPGIKRHKAGQASDDGSAPPSRPAYDAEPAAVDGPLADNVVNHVSSHIQTARQLPSEGRGRPAAVPLDDAERERIIRETRARLAAENGVVQAEFETDADAPRRLSTHTKRPRWLSESDDSDDYAEGALAPQPSAGRRTKRRPHVLSEPEDATDFENAQASGDAVPAARRQPATPPQMRSRQRQPLQLDSAKRGNSQERPRRESFTMSFNVDRNQ
jgi:hypothetical protein